MHRIDTPNAVADLFGAGKKGFGAGDPSTNTPATFLNADWCNAIQEELAAIVEAKFGLDKADRGQVLRALKSNFLANDQIIDRTGESTVALLDRFDVVHKYRVDRTIAGAGNLPTISATTGLVQEGIYKVWGKSAASAALRDFILQLRPNATHYANQFNMNFVNVTASDVHGIGVASTSYPNYSFDTYGGTNGSDGTFEMTVFVERSTHYKKVLYLSADTAGLCTGGGQWLNTSTAWSTLGIFNFYAEMTNPASDYFIELNIRRMV
jgi:hypothetical protein